MRSRAFAVIAATLRGDAATHVQSPHQRLVIMLCCVQAISGNPAVVASAGVPLDTAPPRADLEDPDSDADKGEAPPPGGRKQAKAAAPNRAASQQSGKRAKVRGDCYSAVVTFNGTVLA